MLHFPCPKCGGKVESAENDTASYGARHAKRFASGSMTGHAHPVIALAVTAFTIGNFIWRRVPGGGQKRCANGHIFR